MTRSTAPLTASLPFVYLVHLIDERFWGIGTANWATANTSLYFTNTAWLWVNIPAFLVFGGVALLILKSKLPRWCISVLATHLLLHGAARVAGSLGSASIAPGVVTGFLLCVPVALFVLAREGQLLPRRSLQLALLVGFLSFQPLWHFLLYPFLPHGPEG